MDNKFCNNCGSSINQGDAFCINCGTPTGNKSIDTESNQNLSGDDLNTSIISDEQSSIHINDQQAQQGQVKQTEQTKQVQTEEVQTEEVQAEQAEQVQAEQQQPAQQEQKQPVYQEQPSQKQFYKEQVKQNPYTTSQQYNNQFYQGVQDSKEKPMTTGQFLGTILLGALPIAGLVLYIVWAFSSDTNINKRNFCRAQLIVILVSTVLCILSWIIIIAVIASSARHGRYY